METSLSWEELLKEFDEQVETVLESTIACAPALKRKWQKKLAGNPSKKVHKSKELSSKRIQSKINMTTITKTTKRERTLNQ